MSTTFEPSPKIARHFLPEELKPAIIDHLQDVFRMPNSKHGYCAVYTIEDVEVWFLTSPNREMCFGMFPEEAPSEIRDMVNSKL